MKKKIIVVILILVMALSLALPCFAAGTVSVPNFTGANVKNYYCFYLNATGSWRMISSDAPFYLWWDNVQYQFSSSKTGLSLTGLNVQSFETNNQWGTPWGNTYLTLGTFHPTNFYSSFNIDGYQGNGVLKDTSFFTIALPMGLQVRETILLHGGQVLLGASQTSLIVLVTACLILAILLGVGLIPRVIHLFSR